MANLAQEFKEVSDTKFWQKYQAEIIRIRDLAISNLRNGKIEEPVVRGKIWQEVHRYMDALIELPDKMIDADEADNREARPSKE